MKAEIKIPDGWRRLMPGEYSKPGDRWLSFPDMEWLKDEDCYCSECGQTIKTNIVPKAFEPTSGWVMIRKVSAQPAKRLPRSRQRKLNPRKGPHE